MKKPTQKKKQKNVGFDNLDGKVGRIYMPSQKVDEVALSKPKGLKRARREEQAAKEAARQGGTTPRLSGSLQKKPKKGNRHKTEVGEAPDGGDSGDE